MLDDATIEDGRHAAKLRRAAAFDADGYLIEDGIYPDRVLDIDEDRPHPSDGATLPSVLGLLATLRPWPPAGTVYSATLVHPEASDDA